MSNKRKALDQATIERKREREFERALAASLDQPIVCPTDLPPDERQVVPAAKEIAPGDITLPFDGRPLDAP